MTHSRSSNKVKQFIVIKESISNGSRKQCCSHTPLFNIQSIIAIMMAVSGAELSSCEMSCFHAYQICAG